MEKRDKFRLPLSAAAIYTALVGITQLFPALSEAVFVRPVTDPAIESLLGAVLLALAGMIGNLAVEGNRSPVSVMVLIAGLVLVAGNMTFFWALGQYPLATVVAPVVLNLVLAAWLGTTLIRSVRAPAPAGARR